MKKLFRWCINFIRTLDWNEVFRYFIAGVCATVLNIFTFWLLGKQLGFNEHVSNVVAWILSTMLAFLTNCFFVFRIKPGGAAELFRFLLSFYGEQPVFHSRPLTFCNYHNHSGGSLHEQWLQQFQS